MYLGFVLMKYGKTCRRRNECHERKPFFILTDPSKQQAWCAVQGPHEEALSLLRKQKKREESKGFYCGILRKGKAGKQVQK